MTTSQFQQFILAWHKAHRRDMPWRETQDPYNILVSEVMLQQTQISRVLEKYQEFLSVFPNFQSLAKAQDRTLLKTWSGLGYWKRAANLKKTAKKALKEYQGNLPQDPASLETFPGIGPYTSRALACFAFQNTDAFLDTNIRRVYLHFFFPNKRKVSDKEILVIAQKAVWKENPREWHYALFDYGAMVLRDKTINKRSIHYAKQSRFKGSFRSFRTQVMRFLLDQEKQAATKKKLEKLLRLTKSPYAPDKILASLEKDGLIKRRRYSYSL